MIRYTHYAVRNQDAEVLCPFQCTMTVPRALHSVASGVAVFNYSDLSLSEPFTKFVGFERRNVNTWFGEYDGTEQEILPLFVAAYCVRYIIGKANRYTDLPGYLNFAPFAGKLSPAVLEALERLPVDRLCPDNDDMVSTAMMLASGITDEKDLQTGINLPGEPADKRDSAMTAILELMQESKLPFREVIQLTC